MREREQRKQAYLDSLEKTRFQSSSQPSSATTQDRTHSHTRTQQSNSSQPSSRRTLEMSSDSIEDESEDYLDADEMDASYESYEMEEPSEQIDISASYEDEQTMDGAQLYDVDSYDTPDASVYDLYHNKRTIDNEMVRLGFIGAHLFCSTIHYQSQYNEPEHTISIEPYQSNYFNHSNEIFYRL